MEPGASVVSLYQELFLHVEGAGGEAVAVAEDLHEVIARRKRGIGLPIDAYVLLQVVVLDLLGCTRRERFTIVAEARTTGQHL